MGLSSLVIVSIGLHALYAIRKRFEASATASPVEPQLLAIGYQDAFPGAISVAQVPVACSGVSG